MHAPSRQMTTYDLSSGDRRGEGPPGRDRPILSIAVPCYNEEDVLDELYQRLVPVCMATAGDDFEIILINDGSKDGTWSIIERLAQVDPHIVGVNLARNFGHQLALTAGLTVCRGERILVIDADLQDPPELLPEMMRLVDEGADVVYGQRESRAGEKWFKLATADGFYRLLNRLADVAIPRDTGDFRLMTRQVLDVLNGMPERARFIRGMVAWVGFRQVPLRYRREARFAGQTKYPLRKMLRLAVDAITSFSILPLRIASHLGVAFGLLGIVSMIYVLASWLSGKVVPGWTSVVSLVLILGSLQLLVLGIFGEYLGRIYLESKQRPLFIIDQIVIHKDRYGKRPGEAAQRPGRDATTAIQSTRVEAAGSG